MNNSIGLKQLNLAYNAPCSTGNEEAKKQVKTHSDIDLRHGRDTQRERILKDSSVRSIAQRERDRQTDRQTDRQAETERDTETQEDSTARWAACHKLKDAVVQHSTTTRYYNIMHMHCLESTARC